MALEISKQNNIGKTILNSRFKILRNIFPAENVLNNIVRINCDCNVIEILEKLNIRSVIEKTICSNDNCLKKTKEFILPSLFFQFHNESINNLQQKINYYTQSEYISKICKELNDNKQCNGSLEY